jgi:predicted Zn finger-like uncharacterized protein
MPAVLQCPSCASKLRVPEELAGKKVKCPKCSTAFAAEVDGSSGTVAPLPSAPGADQAPPEANREPGLAGEAATAPAAPAPQPPPAPLEEDERPWERSATPGFRRDGEPHRGVMILVFGILSVCFAMTFWLSIVGAVLGGIAIYLGRHDLERMKSHLVDPQGRDLTRAGWILAIVGTVLCCLCLLGMGAYFVFVFVFLMRF